MVKLSGKINLIIKISATLLCAFLFALNFLEVTVDGREDIANMIISGLFVASFYVVTYLFAGSKPFFIGVTARIVIMTLVVIYYILVWGDMVVAMEFFLPTIIYMVYIFANPYINLFADMVSFGEFNGIIWVAITLVVQSGLFYTIYFLGKKQKEKGKLSDSTKEE